MKCKACLEEVEFIYNGANRKCPNCEFWEFGYKNPPPIMVHGSMLREWEEMIDEANHSGG